MEKAGKILFSIIGDLADQKLVQLIQDWEQIIGERCASHSRIRNLKKRVLLVEVDDPSWLTFMHSHQESFLRKLQKLHPGIHNIHFILSHTERKTPKVPPPAPKQPTSSPVSSPSTPGFPQDEELQKRFQHIADLINNQKSAE